MAPKPKEKAKASAVATPAIAIEDLFTSLNRNIERSKHEQAVKVFNQILVVAPENESVIRCKVVVLVKADSIEEALVAIKDCSKKGLIEGVLIGEGEEDKRKTVSLCLDGSETGVICVVDD